VSESTRTVVRVGARAVDALPPRLRRPVALDRAYFDRALACTGWSGRRHRLGPGAGETDVIVARAAPRG